MADSGPVAPTAVAPIAVVPTAVVHAVAAADASASASASGVVAPAGKFSLPVAPLRNGMRLGEFRVLVTLTVFLLNVCRTVWFMQHPGTGDGGIGGG